MHKLAFILSVINNRLPAAFLIICNSRMKRLTSILTILRNTINSAALLVNCHKCRNFSRRLIIVYITSCFGRSGIFKIAGEKDISSELPPCHHSCGVLLFRNIVEKHLTYLFIKSHIFNHFPRLSLDRVGICFFRFCCTLADSLSS